MVQYFANDHAIHVEGLWGTTTSYGLTTKDEEEKGYVT